MYLGKTFRKMVALLCVVLLALGMLAGCGKVGQSGETTGAAVVTEPTSGTTASETTAPAEPDKISMMNIYWNPEPPKDDSDAMKKYEELCNVDLDMTWIPASMYGDKVTATIASGEIPQVIMVTDNLSNTMRNAMNSGMFWEVGPYIDSYTNLSQMPKFIFNNIKVGGKIYGIYRSRDAIREGIVYRKDWLNNLGLSEPKTLDEVYNVIKAFTLDDPDGDKQQNTYGFGQHKSEGVLVGSVSVWMGAPSNYGEKDGKLYPAFTDEAYLDALKFYKRLYDEKLMNQDFAVVEVPQWKDLMIKGKVGMIFAVLDTVEEMGDLYTLNPKAELDVIHAVDAGKGMRLPASQGYSGVFMFPKSSVKDEAQLKKILAFIDRTIDKEVQDFMDWGFEGVHYTLENGKPTKTEDQGKLYNDEINPLGQFRVDFSKGMKGNTPPLFAKFQQLYKDNLKYAVSDLSQGLNSETSNLKSDQIAQNITDAETKFIMGVLDEAGWNKAIEQWRQNGGNKIIEELTAEYVKNKN